MYRLIVVVVSCFVYCRSSARLPRRGEDREAGTSVRHRLRRAPFRSDGYGMPVDWGGAARNHQGVESEVQQGRLGDELEVGSGF